MAIIAISRQVAALGDEIAIQLAKELNYTFIDRKKLENKILELGFPQEKLEKYDEKKPGFFASLAKDRDEYLDYLQMAILEFAVQNNCILIGRGAFSVLANIPHVFAARFIAKDSVRVARLMAEFNWDQKQAEQRIEESDTNRIGFHKSFFNLSNQDPSYFHVILNTGIIDDKNAAQTLAYMIKNTITATHEKEGKLRLDELLIGQKLVNALIFEHKININFLRAVVKGNIVTLQGVAESAAIAEKAVLLSKKIIQDKEINSCISVVQDFKAYP